MDMDTIDTNDAVKAVELIGDENDDVQEISASPTVVPESTGSDAISEVEGNEEIKKDKIVSGNDNDLKLKTIDDDNDKNQVLEEDIIPEQQQDAPLHVVDQVGGTDLKVNDTTPALIDTGSGTTGTSDVAMEVEEAPLPDKPVNQSAPPTATIKGGNPQAELSSIGSPFVVPLASPRIPSLAYKTVTHTKVTDKEIKPTPSSFSAASGDSVFKLLPLCKNITSALAPQRLPAEKRKHMGGCCNANCTQISSELVVAPKHAIIYFHFNTSVKKIFKICTNCLADADKYITKAVRAVQNGDCVLTFKTDPQGMDGDVIEVSAGDEEDDPAVVAEMEAKENEIVELAEDFDSVLSSILNRIDAKKQMEKCDKAAQLEVQYLERDLVSLESKLLYAEKQMIEAKKMYDVLTGHCQPVPVILEELDIDVNGIIKRARGNNPHIGKMVDNHQEIKLKDIIREKCDERFPAIPKDEKVMKENRQRKPEPEIDVMEVEPVQKAQDTKIYLAPTPKIIPRVMPSVGSIVYALNRTLLHFWLKGEVIEIVNTGPGKPAEFIVKFLPLPRELNYRDPSRRDPAIQQTKQVTSKQIAYNLPCPFVLPVGSRIIAKFRDELKTEPAGDGQFYAGAVAEPPKNTNNFRYLVFFDDGYAQYVHHKDVLMVYESSKEVWLDVHPDSADFIRNYVQKYPERPMVRLNFSQVITTEWNGKWWVARVVELDCSLVKMKFENDGRFEWIYRGSTRLSPLFEKQNRQKTRQVARRQTAARSRNQPTIEYNYGEEDIKKVTKPVAKKSTGMMQNIPDRQTYVARMPRCDYGEFEGSIIKKPIPSTAPKPKNYEPHKCKNSCLISYNESDRDLRKLNPLALPLYTGWSREFAKTPRRTVFYRGPCGKRLRDMEELYAYLSQTNCSIPIDHFCFELAVDCLNEFRHSRQHSFLPDLTYGKEVVPVQVVNAFDFEYPPYVEYSSKRIAGTGVNLNTEDEFLVGCDCTDDCTDKSKCSCWQLTLSGISFTKLNNEEYPLKGYENRRLQDHIVSGVYECNPRCKCRKTCMNRVVQNGLKVPLQVFKTAAKGWGIRPLFDIPEGSFICIYAGQVLTEQGANEDGKQFGDEYLAELDYIECNESIKADYESDVTDIEEEEEDKRKKKKSKNLSDDEYDSHANDSSYRGPRPTTSRTITTRNKNGQGSTLRNESDEEEDDGTRKRSRFNPVVGANSSKSAKEERLPLRELFGKDEQCYIMDAKTVGNIGRYLNHSCQPNVFVQNVFVDTHDLRFPWVSFFSSKHIRAGSELTWDYNYDIGSVPDKVMFCYCGSPECRGRLL